MSCFFLFIPVIGISECPKCHLCLYSVLPALLHYCCYTVTTLPTFHNIPGTPVGDRVPVQGTSEGINILGLLVFCVAFGLILGSMGTEGNPLRDFFDCLNKSILRLVSIVTW